LKNWKKIISKNFKKFLKKKKKKKKENWYWALRDLAGLFPRHFVSEPFVALIPFPFPFLLKESQPSLASASFLFSCFFFAREKREKRKGQKKKKKKKKK
jgi:hypothetical protein